MKIRLVREHKDALLGGMMQTYRSHRGDCIRPARFGQRNAGGRLSVTHGSFLVEFVRSRAEILTGCFLLFSVWMASFLFELIRLPLFFVGLCSFF